jgi:hypothetical protein
MPLCHYYHSPFPLPPYPSLTSPSHLLILSIVKLFKKSGLRGWTHSFPLLSSLTPQPDSTFPLLPTPLHTYICAYTKFNHFCICATFVYVHIRKSVDFCICATFIVSHFCICSYMEVKTYKKVGFHIYTYTKVKIIKILKI